MESGKVLKVILDIGEAMLVSGGEVSRVEDTIARICRAYGMSRINVFIITTSIVVTVSDQDGEMLTQTRRIYSYSTNFTKLELLNDLSRTLCETIPDISYMEDQLEGIQAAPMYTERTYYLAYALISASFSIFFGGSLWDAGAAALIGILLRYLLFVNRRLEMNFIVNNLMCSLVGGLLAVVLTRIGFGESVDKIVIGNIMLLIPGISLTNSIRDMINGDIMSGVMRLSEAIIISIAIAVGFAIVLVL